MEEDWHEEPIEVLRRRAANFHPGTCLCLCCLSTVPESHSNKDRQTGDEVFPLSFKAWENAYWTVLNRSHDLEEGSNKKDVVNALMVILPIPDGAMWRDAFVNKKIHARLLSGGEGFTIFVPAMTSIASSKDGIKLIHSGKTATDKSAQLHVSCF